MAMLKTCPNGKTSLRRIAEYLVVPQEVGARKIAQAKARRARALAGKGFSDGVKEYLWGDPSHERALAQIPFNLKQQTMWTQEMSDEWAKEMDATRVAAGHDKDARKGHPSPRWKHYVISPDPKDNISLPDLMSLAFDWYEHFFGNRDAYVKGKLGTFEGMIVFHNDNANQIPHAHIVVNCTNLDNGKRIHISDAENDELAYFLQDLCRERGLSAFDDTPSQKISRQVQSRDAQDRRPLPATVKQRKLLQKLARCGVVTKKELTALGPEEKWTRGEVSDVIAQANKRKKENAAAAVSATSTTEAVSKKTKAAKFPAASESTAVRIPASDLATHKQKGFVKDLAERGIISQSEIAALGSEATWTKVAVNKLLNAHSNVAGHLDLAENVVYDTRRPSEQAVYRTTSERKARGRGVYGWKEEIRDAVKVAAASSSNEEGFFAQLASMGVGVEKKGGDYLYFHPDMHITPDSTAADRKAATRKVYGRKCGQNFTPQGVKNMQGLSYFRDAWEQGVENGGQFKLVGAFNFNRRTFKNVTVTKASDAVNKYGIELLAELVRLDETAGGRFNAQTADALEQLDKEMTEKLRWIRNPEKREEYINEEKAKRDKLLEAAAYLGMWEYKNKSREEVESQAQRIVELRHSGYKKINHMQPLSAEEFKAATPIMRQKHKMVLNAERSSERKNDDATFWGGSGSSGKSRSRGRGR